MPQDELTKKHYLSLKTMVDTFSDDHPDGSFEKETQDNAHEALRILATAHPEWLPQEPFKEPEDEDLFNAFKECAEIILNWNKAEQLIVQLRLRLTR